VEWTGSIKVGKEKVIIYGPAFSIFGASTERAFFVALKKKEVASGFVNRHFLLNVGRGCTHRVKPKVDWQSLPVWLVKALKEVAGEPPKAANRPLRHDKWVVRDFVRIGWGPGAEEYWYKFDDEIRNLPSVEDRELWIRAPEIALRIATIVAVFRGSKVVALEDLEWAIAVARHSAKQIAHGLQKHMLEDYEQADLVERIREEFRRKGELRLPNPQTLRTHDRRLSKDRRGDLSPTHLRGDHRSRWRRRRRPTNKALEMGGAEKWGEIISGRTYLSKILKKLKTPGTSFSAKVHPPHAPILYIFYSYR